MVARRLLATALLLALVVAGAWLLRPVAPQGGAGDYAVALLGPDGFLWNGTVRLDAGNATALGALHAAAQQAGLSVAVGQTALGAYVRAVGPHAETATDGWCFFLLRDGRTEAPFGSADATGLRRGDAVLWSWSSRAPGPC